MIVEGDPHHTASLELSSLPQGVAHGECSNSRRGGPGLSVSGGGERAKPIVGAIVRRELDVLRRYLRDCPLVTITSDDVSRSWDRRRRA